MTGAGFVRCEKPAWFKGSWWECGKLANLVTFPRSIPLWLCPEHEAEATKARAACVLVSETAKNGEKV